MKGEFKRTSRSIAWLVGLIGGFLLLASIVACAVAQGPKSQMLTACTNSVIKTQFRVTTSPNYHLAIAMPQQSLAAHFEGSVKVSNATGYVTVPITSGGLQPSLEFQGMPCQLLTWLATNRPVLNQILSPGMTCTFDFEFTAMPPPGSVIVLTSLGKVCF